MTSVEFVEEILGIKLLEYQKEILRKLDAEPSNQIYLLYPPHHGRTDFRILSSVIKSIYGGALKA